MDILEHLTKEHREAERLLGALGESDPGPERDALLEELTDALTTHMAVEEQFLYPVVQQAMGDDTDEEARNEHDLARDGLRTLAGLASEPGFGAAVDMLKGGIEHHVHEEEHEIFPKLRDQAADQLSDLDPEQLQARVRSDDLTRDELYQQAKEAGIPGRSDMTKQELADALAEQ
jgi:iron-sulfur cluster repair protein YtfE (RIC family)